MAALGLTPGEPIYADVTTPLSRNVFPVIEATLYTGLAGIALGILDSPTGISYLGAGTTTAHQAILGIWALFILFRLILPVLRSRRRRIIVTDTRLIVREPALNGAVAAFDLEHILGVNRHGSTLHIRVLGMRNPFIIDKAPKAKKLAATIERLAAHNRAHVPYLP